MCWHGDAGAFVRGRVVASPRRAPAKPVLWEDQQRRAAQVGDKASELAALDGGPAGGQWYWREDLERQQQAARAVAEGFGSPLSPIAKYVPTTRGRTHRVDERCRGRVWVFEG